MHNFLGIKNTTLSLNISLGNRTTKQIYYHDYCNNINLVRDMLTGIDLCNQILVVVEAGHRLGKVLLLVVLPITDESCRS